MYSLGQLVKGLKNPRLAATEIQSQMYDLYFQRIHSHQGFNFMEANWDTLIILDACRYDLFKEVNNIEGDLSCVQSPASETEQFLRSAVEGQSFPDTVYITANPQITKIETQFHALHFLWETHWDSELNTVKPEAVTDFTINSLDQYQDKRLIVHYIQPHMPFIGPTGQQINQAPFEGGTLNTSEAGEQNIWHQLRQGNIAKETAWGAYQENLELVLDAVEPLLNKQIGKTVLTSDHGNAFGEWGVYGHPPHRHIDSIIDVPWLELDYDSRREITTGESTESPMKKQRESIERHLGYLGYA